MKKLVVMALALSVLMTACGTKETVRVNMWRFAEPRLGGVDGYRHCEPKQAPARAVPQSRCEAGEFSDSSPDPLRPESREQAAQMLRYRFSVSQAITKLQLLADRGHAVHNDLAAAYYIRAQYEDDPADLLSAFENVQKALATEPRMPEARFNLALIEEALGLSNDAATDWDEFRKGERSDWAKEAGEHAERLARARASDANARWAATRQQLNAALHSGDARAVARLIVPFPLSARRYLEDELLPHEPSETTAERLRHAQLLATELSRRSGDRYPLDLVTAVASSLGSPERIQKLTEGHRKYREGRHQEATFKYAEAAGLYHDAAELFAQGGSPLRIRAELRAVVALALDTSVVAQAGVSLEPLIQEARARHYASLTTELTANEGLLLGYKSQYVRSLEAYEAAHEGYERLNDPEDAAIIRIRRIGILRVAGQLHQSWSMAVRESRRLGELVDIKERHNLLGETAQTAAALGFPKAALSYQNEALRLIEKELAAASPTDSDLLITLQTHKSISLRRRAGLEVTLGDQAACARDLEESSRLQDSPHRADDGLRAVLRAHTQEVEGQQALLASKPKQAIAAFSKALTAAGKDEYRTFRAHLLAQRSEAYRQSGDRRSAEADLRSALDELDIEEKAILEERDPRANTDTLSRYFSRFQDTYRLLIHQLVEENRMDEAFLYVEKARAGEPLNLIGYLAPLSDCLRKLSLKDNDLGLRHLQATLPTGTILLEYCLLEDRTYVWIVSREQVEIRELRAKPADITRWANTLHEAATEQRSDLFEEGLYAPFLELIDKPLKAARQMNGGRPIERLVIIPDGVMHALPFAGLRNSDSMKYLAEEAPIAIQGSAALYLVSLCREAEVRHASPSLLLVGDPALKERLSIAEGLRDLPSAKEEVNEIGDEYRRNHVVVTTLIGEQATVPAFLSAAPGKTIIHIAAHAIANSSSPSHSALLLAPSAEDSGVLYAEDLLKKLRLPDTRLVVLSACSTGGGAPIGPEGVAPLVRPLIGMGVPAVIGSLWGVDDATAKELLVSFHRHYRSEDAASAMRSAQLDLLHGTNPNLKSPMAWSSFEVIGHASSPFARSP